MTVAQLGTLSLFFLGRTQKEVENLSESTVCPG